MWSYNLQTNFTSISAEMKMFSVFQSFKDLLATVKHFDDGLLDIDYHDWQPPSHTFCTFASHILHEPYLCWRTFRLWKIISRICQWIYSSLDISIWKKLSPKYWLFEKIIFFLFEGSKTFLYVRNLFGHFWP